mgnify:CR=1 FL=1
MILHYKLNKWFSEPQETNNEKSNIAKGKKPAIKLRIKPRLRLFRRKHIFMYVSQEFGKI